jgi:hypothetical protein
MDGIKILLPPEPTDEEIESVNLANEMRIEFCKFFYDWIEKYKMSDACYREICLIMAGHVYHKMTGKLLNEANS